MLKGLGGATIWSEDLNNLLPFYRDLLRLRVAYEQPGFVGFGERATVAGTVARTWVSVHTARSRASPRAVPSHGRAGERRCRR